MRRRRKETAGWLGDGLRGRARTTRKPPWRGVPALGWLDSRLEMASLFARQDSRARQRRFQNPFFILSNENDYYYRMKWFRRN